MSKKQDTARWRNLAKGRIAMMTGNITNILHSLPESKPISQTEINNLIQIRKDLNGVLSNWDTVTEIVLNKLNN